jgi:hypothetical protein
MRYGQPLRLEWEDAAVTLAEAWDWVSRLLEPGWIVPNIIGVGQVFRGGDT